MTDPVAGAPPRDNLPLAVGAILLAVLALSLGDALVKQASGSFPLWQIFVLRSLLLLPVLFAWAAFVGDRSMWLPRRPVWTAVRSLLLVGMWVAYYASLPHLQLAVAAAAYYTLPIFITLFSAALVGERVGQLGWLAVATGFCGVLLILRPEAGAVDLHVLLPLGAAMLYALAMILTRTRCRGEHPLALSIALNGAFMAVGGAATMFTGPLGGSGFLYTSWTPMGAAEWGAMALLALSIMIGSIGAAIAYQNGRPAVIGTFDFTYVGFAVLWGLAFFGEVPDVPAVAGLALIVVAGILSLRP